MHLASEETKQKLDFGKQYNSIINIVFNKTSHIWDLSEGHFFRLHNYEIWILREVHSYDQYWEQIHKMMGTYSL